MKAPKLRFKEFNSKWEIDIMGNYVDVQTGPFGSQLHEKDYVKEGTPIITVEHFGDNRVIHKNLPLVSDKDKLRLKKYSLSKGDIVFSRVGSVDRRVLISEMEEGWLFSGRCLRLRTSSIKLDTLFLSFFIGTKKCLNEIKSKAVGGTMPSLNTEILNSITIQIPSIDEQHKIGSFLNILDKKIQLQQEKINLLKEQKKGFIQKIFSQELRFKGFNEDWKECKLGNLVEIVTGKLDANAMDENGKYDFYTSGIKKYKINIPAFEGPAITIAGNGATVGYMHYADGLFNAYQRTYVLSKFAVNRDFLFHYIGFKLPKKIQQEARTGNIPYIVMDMLTELRIKLPSDSEQEKIGQVFKILDKLIKLNEEKISLLQEQKKGFMQQMFI